MTSTSSKPEFYPYRATVEKIEDAQSKIAEAGDTVLSAHFVSGRDWVLLCRRGDDQPSAPTDLSALLDEALEPVVEALRAIANAVAVGTCKDIPFRDNV